MAHSMSKKICGSNFPLKGTFGGQPHWAMLAFPASWVDHFNVSPYAPLPPETQDPMLCHHCNENRLDPKWKYLLKNGIEVCKECHEKAPKKNRYKREPRR